MLRGGDGKKEKPHMHLINVQCLLNVTKMIADVWFACAQQTLNINICGS